MKILSLLLFLIMGININTANETIFDYTMKDIDGEEVSLDAYKGKVILIVNVASKCGYTPQYEGLQNLYDSRKDDGLVILGFPANNFNEQEPGTNEDIKQFCTLNFGVEFPMFSKISVKGDDQADLFRYLTTAENPDFTGEVKWNFEKFLINKDGSLIRRFRSNVEPESEEIMAAINRAMNN